MVVYNLIIYKMMIISPKYTLKIVNKSAPSLGNSIAIGCQHDPGVFS